MHTTTGASTRVTRTAEAERAARTTRTAGAARTTTTLAAAGLLAAAAGCSWEAVSRSADGGGGSYRGAEHGPSAGATLPASGPAASTAVAAPTAPLPATDLPRPPAPPEQARGGLLTAGSFDDNRNPAAFRAFLGHLGQRQDLGPLAARLSGPRTLVRLRDTLGQPVGGARVRIAGHERVLVTKSSGEAALYAGWDGFQPGEQLTIEVESPGGDRVVASVRAGDDVEVQVAAAGSLPVQLDLALIIDATGSMGDEMTYLQAEVEAIARAVAKRFPNVDQRYALIVYRDQGDEYVTRSFDFTPDLGRFAASLRAQSAGGGGDYPEAMHDALGGAARLEWRDHPSVARVAFLVADAPPHAGDMGRALEAVEALRREGVVVHSLAASGVAEEAELVMRSASALTLGQYLFLTDDSGIGNTHAEPHIPCYHVERLAGLMARVIASELAGRRLDPDPADIVRTVGRPLPGGLCGETQAVAAPAARPVAY